MFAILLSSARILAVYRLFLMAIKFLRESVEELHKVTWPTQAQAVQLVIATIIVVIIAALAIGVLDFSLSAGYEQLINLAK